LAFADSQTGGLILEGSMPVEITLAGTVSKGDALGYATGWKRALATVGTAIQTKCVAAMDGKTGDKIVAYFGKCIIGGRFTGGTPGAEIFQAEGTDNGKYTETVPSTQGDVTKKIGNVIWATVIVVDPGADLDAVHA
jgi:hypothetical protein